MHEHVQPPSPDLRLRLRLRLRLEVHMAASHTQVHAQIRQPHLLVESYRITPPSPGPPNTNLLHPDHHLTSSRLADKLHSDPSMTQWITHSHTCRHALTSFCQSSIVRSMRSSVLQSSAVSNTGPWIESGETSGGSAADREKRDCIQGSGKEKRGLHTGDWQIK